MTERHRGACFCGAVEFEVSGPPLEMGYCHCASCRAYAGEAFSSYILWSAQAVTVTRGAALLGGYNKTGMSNRRFCSRCGGHVLTEHPGLGVTDVRPGAVPGVRFVPTVHLNYAEAVRAVHDGLPKLRDFPAVVGGSGELIPE